MANRQWLSLKIPGTTPGRCDPIFGTKRDWHIFRDDEDVHLLPCGLGCLLARLTLGDRYRCSLQMDEMASQIVDLDGTSKPNQWHTNPAFLEGISHTVRKVLGCGGGPLVSWHSD